MSEAEKAFEAWWKGDGPLQDDIQGMCRASFLAAWNARTESNQLARDVLGLLLARGSIDVMAFSDGTFLAERVDRNDRSTEAMGLTATEALEAMVAKVKSQEKNDAN